MNRHWIILLMFSAIGLGKLPHSRGPAISREGAEVIQAFIDQRPQKNGPLRVFPNAFPTVFDPEPFPNLDPAINAAAKRAWESCKPVETTPMVWLDSARLQGVTFTNDPGEYYYFDQPLFGGSQALLIYGYARKSDTIHHQVLFLRTPQGWKLTEDRVF